LSFAISQIAAMSWPLPRHRPGLHCWLPLRPPAFALRHYADFDILRFHTITLIFIMPRRDIFFHYCRRHADYLAMRLLNTPPLMPPFAFGITPAFDYATLAFFNIALRHFDRFHC
jgi:hypothetical protein